jgi:phage terminase Nu1 subunit (DNA packaging protein)
MSAVTSFRETDHRSPDELVRDYRQRQADEEHERAERKRLQLADQRSELNDAKARIQAWEKVHALRLPASPTHPVLQVIAAATALMLSEVLEEQRQRCGRARAAAV